MIYELFLIGKACQSATRLSKESIIYKSRKVSNEAVNSQLREINEH